MTNKELSVILRMRDEASKRLEGFKGNLQRFANSWKKNWLAISATVTASIMALKKAWDLMQESAKMEQIENSFEKMAEGMGLSAEKMKQAIMDMSAGTVSFSSAANKVTALMAQGLGLEQIAMLMRQARVEARIFGQTTEEAFSVMANAVNSGMLKPLEKAYGLQMSLKDAVSNYAKATGMSTQEVERNYQAQAVANHILEQSKMHREAVNLEIMTSYEKVQKLQAQWSDFTQSLGKGLWNILGFLQGVLQLFHSGFYSMLAIGITITQAFMDKVADLFELVGNLPGKIGEAFREMEMDIRVAVANLDECFFKFGDRAKEIDQKMQEQFRLVFAQTQNGADNTAGILRDMAQQVRQQAQSIAQSYNALLEFTKQTARNMENAFSELFFKTFSNQLSSAQEVFINFGESILRTLSQILAKIMMIKMLTAMAGPGGQIFGISVNQLFHSGGIIKKHSGGMITAHGGLAPDEVPIIAQTGEGVLSRKGMRTLGGSDNLRDLNAGRYPAQGGVTININQAIQAWDAQDVWRNRKMLSNAIAEDIYNNGTLRSVIRSYA